MYVLQYTTKNLMFILSFNPCEGWVNNDSISNITREPVVSDLFYNVMW